MRKVTLIRKGSQTGIRLHNLSYNKIEGMFVPLAAIGCLQYAVSTTVRERVEEIEKIKA